MKLKVIETNADVTTEKVVFNTAAMAEKPVTTFHKVLALVLCVCIELFLFYAARFVVHSAFGHLARLWVFAALRWSVIIVTALLVLGDLKPLLIRFITAHSLLPAVLETGTWALSLEESQCGRVVDVRCWLMLAGASLGAALFWEITIPDCDEETENKEQKHKSRVLFKRVLYLYYPDYLLLLGGLVFLTLAVICK